MSTEQFAPGFRGLVPENATLERVAGGFTFTEGPVWNSEEGYLVWTEIIGDAIYQYVPGQGTSLFLSPSGKADGMTFDLEGRLLVAGWSSRNVWRLEHDSSTTVLASHVNGVKLNTPNDIICKSDGSIYFTDPSNGLRNVGMDCEDVQKYIEYEAVYRLNPDNGDLTLLLDDFANPNGLCFSPDESLLYVNDTPRRHIRVFEVQPDGTVAKGRLFCQLDGADPGAPDGMKVDTLGNVYCTGPGGVWVIDPQGNPLGRILTPEHCANFTFGGDDARTVYFTARSAIYRMRVNVPGIPTYPKPGAGRD